MKFFCSPIKLLSLIKEKEKYVIKEDKRNAEWYFSEDGKNAYEKADTLAKKTSFFCDYLNQKTNIKEEPKGCFGALSSANKDKKPKNDIVKMAFFLATGVAKSNLSYSNYPDILDESKNLMVAFFTKNGVFDTCSLLAILKGEDSREAFSEPSNAPYRKISYCRRDDISELYRLERLIIGIGEAENDSKLAAPFVHDFYGKEVK